MGKSSAFLQTLKDERPEFTVELSLELPDGEPAKVKCQDLAPKQWWQIPDNEGLPIIAQKLVDEGGVKDWSDVEKMQYWDYLRHVCILSIKEIRDFDESTGKAVWYKVEFIDNEEHSGLTGKTLRLTIDQFDTGDNVAKVGQEVIFFRELRRGNAGHSESGNGKKGSSRVRKSSKRKRADAT